LADGIEVMVSWLQFSARSRRLGGAVNEVSMLTSLGYGRAAKVAQTEHSNQDKAEVCGWGAEKLKAS
jgi:hypothetical protein